MEIQPLKRYPLPHNILILSFLTIIYAFLAYIGHYFSPSSNLSSYMWPASGFALSITLLFGTRAAIAVLLGCWIELTFRLSAIPDAPSSMAIGLISFGLSLGSTLQAVVGAWLIQHFETSFNLLQSPLSVSKMLFWGLVSCFIGATISLAVLSTSGSVDSGYLKFWWIWFLADAGGVFTITPLLLAWFSPYVSKKTRGHPLEIVGLLLLFIVATILNLNDQFRFFYLFFPGLIWASSHFGFRGASVALLYTMIFITYGTVIGFGSFVRPSLEASLFYLEFFILTTTGTILLLTADLEKRESGRKAWTATGEVVRFAYFREIFRFTKKN